MRNELCTLKKVAIKVLIFNTLADSVLSVFFKIYLFQFTFFICAIVWYSN